MLSDQSSQLIEAVQRRFTKKLLLPPNLTYSERLLHIGLDTLESRRLEAGLKFIQHCINSCYGIELELLFIKMIPTRSRFFDEHKLLQPQSKKNIRHNFLTVKLIPIYNLLPKNLRNLPADKFSSNLKNFLLD